MFRRASRFALVPVLLAVGLASAQEYPLMEMIAKKVIEKYQTSSCQELAQQKSHPPTPNALATMEAALGGDLDGRCHGTWFHKKRPILVVLIAWKRGVTP